MKKLVIALGLSLITSGLVLEAKKETYSTKEERCTKSEKPVSCCNPNFIHKTDFINGNYTIDFPGAYALAEDVQGEIAIKSSDVCLDLQRHTIQSAGEAPAINVPGPASNIQINNGTIRGGMSNSVNIANTNGLLLQDLMIITPTQANGLLVSSSSDICLNNLVFTNESAGTCIVLDSVNNVKLNNLSFENRLGIGIVITTGSNINLQDLHFFPVNQPLQLTNVSNCCINKVDASNNTTTGDMIRVTGAYNINLTSIDISDCTVDRSANSTGYGIARFSDSNDITLACSTFNNNECVDLLYYATIYFGACSKVKIDNIQANCNKVTSEAVATNGVDNVFVGYGNDFYIYCSQFNDTSELNSEFYVAGLGFIDIQNLTIESCEISGTTLEKFIPTEPSFNRGAFGLYLEVNCSVVSISNTQVNDTTINQIDKTATTQNPASIAAAHGIFLQEITRCRIENCQANGTTIKAVLPTLSTTNNITHGFYIEKADDLEIFNTEACRSFSAGDQAYGFDLYGSSGNNPVLFSDCKGNCNKAQALAAGFATHINSEGYNVGSVTIENCCANNNTAERGYGFAFEGGDKNTIAHSYASGNTTSGFYLGRLLSGRNNITQIDTKLIRNCAECNGLGFLFASQGSPSRYSISNLLVLENTAVYNKGCGFKRDGSNFESETWIGNAAEDNNPDFCIDPIDVEEIKTGHLSCDETKSFHEVNVSLGGSRS